MEIKHNHQVSFKPNRSGFLVINPLFSEKITIVDIALFVKCANIGTQMEPVHHNK